MILKSFIQLATEKLKKKNISSASLDIKILVSDHYSFEFHELILNENLVLTEKDKKKLNNRVERRLSGEPVAYIVGYKYFYKSKFFVNNNVLIPRPETELLVEQALKWCIDKENISILDMGAGSGCLGQSVLKELPSASLYSIDISEKATSIAKQNALQLGLEKRIKFDVNNINELPVDKFTGNFDLVLANPPYIDLDEGFVEEFVKKFEPSIALFSKDKGLKDILSWTTRALSWLKPGGLYLMEFGDNQSNEVEKIFKQNNFFMDLSLHKDYSGLPRFVRAIK